MSNHKKVFHDERGNVVVCCPDYRCRDCLIKEMERLRGMISGAESELAHRENVDKLQRTQIAALEAQAWEWITGTPKEGAACTLGEIHRAIVSQQGPERFRLKDCTDLNEGMVAGFIAGYDHALVKNHRKITAWREFLDGFKELKKSFKSLAGTTDQKTQDGVDAALKAVECIIKGGS